MIINTGQRTDIPAFYSTWFMNRVREGFVMVRNPYFPSIVTKFSLSPKVVDIIGFCTKNPRPMLEYLHELKCYSMLWQITINAYESDLEPNVPPIDEVIEDVKILSKKLGKNSLAWRYTPVIINQKYTIEKHIKTFEYIAKNLAEHVSYVVFGFLDLYEKLQKIHPEIKDCRDDEKIILTKEFVKIARKYNLDLRLCSKEKWLDQYGVDVSGCMRIDDYERCINSKLDIKQKMQARKSYCSCYLSNDIGSYSSCLHFCTYCYANGSRNEVLANTKKHDVNSPLIIGNITEEDEIREAKQESFVSGQISLFN